ncbi:MAG: AsmA-like C-terminal region-containing protein [Verrucomicrobiota bacterium JB024]|nr:AsmA-like C-terminal region-containing protein [Verrucomicrobiota bacterium JB024]
MSTPSPAPVRPWWKCLLGGLHWLVNLGLVVALGAQGVLLYLLWEDGELPIPGFVVEKLEKTAAEQGFEVDIGSMKLDLRGILLLREVKVGLSGYHEPVAEIDLILVDFPPWAVIDRGFLPNEIWISRCNLYCPTVLSPTGAREQIAEDIFTEVAIRHKRLDLDRLILRVGGLDIRADGSVPVELLEGLGSGEKKTPEERDRAMAAGYADLCRAVLEFHPWLDRFTDPRIQLNFAPAPEGLRVVAQLQAETFNLGQGIEGQRMTARAEGVGKDAATFRLVQARTRLRQLTWEEKVTARAAQIEAVIPRRGLRSWPTACHLGAIDVEGLNLTADAITAELSAAQMDQPKGWLHLESGSNWLRVDGQVDRKKEIADLSVSARWDPIDLLKISFLEGKFEHPPDLVCSQHPRWQGHVRLDEGFKFAAAEVGIDFGKTRYEKLELDSAYARASITPTLIDVHQARLATSRYVVEGQYREELDTHRYRYLLEGNVDPLEIGFLIDADWWEPLWKDFTFHGQLPYSNIDIQGIYGQGDKGKTFFGYNRLVDFTYQRVPVESFTAMLWREQARIILYDMDGRNEHGAFDAAIQFNYTPDGETRTSLGFAAATTLPLIQAASLAGDEAVSYVEDFTLTSAPRLQVNGLTVDGTDGAEDALYLKVVADMDTRTTYEGFIFDHLAFTGFMKPDLLQLRKIVFGMAGGEGTGQADVKIGGGDGQNEMALGLSLRGASYGGLMEAVPLLTKHEEEKDAQKKLAPDPAENQATIDFDLNVQGKTGDVSTFRGHGNLGVRNALLGQFHLFGGFSRAIQAIGLNLGTVDFTKGSAPFVLGKGYAHFPNVTIAGPTARIDANGNLNLDNNELDFYLSLYPLGGVNIPVISTIFSAINPLTDVVEAQLSGTLKEPKWAVDFRPLGVLMGQKKVDNPTGETLPESGHGGQYIMDD